MPLPFFFFGLFLKWNIKAELARRHPKSPNLVRRMRTRRTTTRENQWGDNEEEEVSKDPEDPALGDYDSNGCCFNSLCCPLKPGVGGTDLVVFHLRGQPAARSPFSGVTEPITILTVLFILTLNRCRWRAELALPTGAGLMYMCGRHQLVIQLSDEYDAGGLIHQYTGCLWEALSLNWSDYMWLCSWILARTRPE